MTAPYPLGLGLSFFNTQSFLQAKESLNGGLTLKAGGLSITNVTPGWVPTDLGSKLVGFIDATNNASITQATGVSQILDTVGNNAFIQATGANQPTLVTTSIGQVMRFNGTSQQLTFTGLPTGWTSTGACEWWAVATQGTLTSAAQNVITLGNGVTTASQGIATVYNTVQTIEFVRASSGDGTTGLSANNFLISLSQGSTFVARCLVSPTTLTSVVNGIGDTRAVGVRSLIATRARIGATSQGSAGGFWTGDISAIVITNAVLTGADLANMNYWAQTRAQVWQ